MLIDLHAILPLMRGQSYSQNFNDIAASRRNDWAATRVRFQQEAVIFSERLIKTLVLRQQRHTARVVEPHRGLEAALRVESRVRRPWTCRVQECERQKVGRVTRQHSPPEEKLHDSSTRCSLRCNMTGNGAWFGSGTGAIARRDMECYVVLMRTR